jgi:hypothetical protein
MKGKNKFPDSMLNIDNITIILSDDCLDNIISAGLFCLYYRNSANINFKSFIPEENDFDECVEEFESIIHKCRKLKVMRFVVVNINLTTDEIFSLYSLFHNVDVEIYPDKDNDWYDENWIDNFLIDTRGMFKLKTNETELCRLYELCDKTKAKDKHVVAIFYLLDIFLQFGIVNEEEGTIKNTSVSSLVRFKWYYDNRKEVRLMLEHMTIEDVVTTMNSAVQIDGKVVLDKLVYFGKQLETEISKANENSDDINKLMSSMYEQFGFVGVKD